MTYNFTTDIVIGLEIHIEPNTDSKMFCSCKRSADKDEQPNTRTCEVCLGMPGSKPVLNKKAVDYAIKLCLATNSKIAKQLVFSRKSYFYPDLAKNYQISQFEIPLGSEGIIKMKDGSEVGITRIHLEEDPASLVHPGGSLASSNHVLVDYNRSGDPLIEIVTEPEIKSADHAREFLKQLLETINYLDIFDINTCLIKADANISIKESGYTRAEVKNITGFKEIERALNYELHRQKKAVAEGTTLTQETRSWDPNQGITTLLRKKETEDDYGYIIDPDLTAVDITDEWISEIKNELPELSLDKIEKFKQQYNIPEEDAKIIAAERTLAELFERVAKEVDPVLAAKWLRRELMRVVNYTKKSLKQVELDEVNLIKLLKLVENKTITETTAQKLLEQLIEKPFDVEKHVEQQGLAAVSDKDELHMYCTEAVEENPQAVEEFKSGKEKALNFIVGSVMKKTKGTASPKEVLEIIKEIIK